MTVDASILKELIRRELSGLTDQRILSNIERLLVEPRIIMRDWDYGEPNEQFPCWAVLDDDPSNSSTGIAFCEHGFGPRNPWGLVSLDDENLSMGMDAGWYQNFLDAYFESFAAAAVPIWRVFKTDSAGARVALTDEIGWDDAWTKTEELRRSYPTSRFEVGHDISFKIID